MKNYAKHMATIYIYITLYNIKFLTKKYGYNRFFLRT